MGSWLATDGMVCWKPAGTALGMLELGAGSPPGAMALRPTGIAGTPLLAIPVYAGVPAELIPLDTEGPPYAGGRAGTLLANALAFGIPP